MFARAARWSQGWVEDAVPCNILKYAKEIPSGGKLTSFLMEITLAKLVGKVSYTALERYELLYERTGRSL